MTYTQTAIRKPDWCLTLECHVTPLPPDQADGFTLFRGWRSDNLSSPICSNVRRARICVSTSCLGVQIHLLVEPYNRPCYLSRRASALSLKGIHILGSLVT